MKKCFSKPCRDQLDPILHAATIFWVVSTLEDIQHPPMGLFSLESPDRRQRHTSLEIHISPNGTSLANRICCFKLEKILSVQD